MSAMGLSVITIETPSLGDRSYVASTDDVAVVVDPQRDLDRFLPLLEGLDVALVLETHVHNDYVTGGLALARATGADYCLAAAEEDLSFERRPVAPGEVIRAGPLEVRPVATPGHTPHHLSYHVSAGDEPGAVFTGGSLLYGNVGRTDLISEAMTRELTVAQFHSARRLLELPGETAVYPTHGFGSFCASSAPVEDDGPAQAAPDDTIAAERLNNFVAQFDDVDAFVEHLLSGLGAYPRYYAHMGPANRKGPSAADLSPPPAAGDLAARLAAGEWVVDLRNRHAYAAGHRRGTIGIELGDSFATYVGWLIPWGTPVTLVADDPDAIAEAQRMLTRIGIDRPAGAATPPPGEAAYPVTDFPGLAGANGAQVLDVRRDEEWEEGHIAGAVHVPIHQVEERHGELPDAELWVHCRSGYRASIAASLLARRGRDVVLVDDDWENAAAAGLPIEAG